MVVTRAREQASGLAQSLMDLGAEVIQCPTIEISPLADYAELDAALANLASYGWVIFTSVNGVKHFWLRLAKAGKDSRALGNCKVAAIGPALSVISPSPSPESKKDPQIKKADALASTFLPLLHAITANILSVDPYPVFLFHKLLKLVQQFIVPQKLK